MSCPHSTRTSSFAVLAVVAALLPARVLSQPTPPPGVAFAAGFQPGGQQLFALDLSGTPVGEVPSTIKLLKGNLEVVLQGGARMLKASSASEFLITLPQVLPPDFTLEFDLVPKRCCPPPDLSIEGTPTINQGLGSAHLLWQADGYLGVVGGAQDNYETPMPEDLKATLPGVRTHVDVSVSGSTIKLYTNGRRLYTLDRQFARGQVLRVHLGGVSDANPVYLAGLRMATGASVVLGGGGGAGAGAGGGGSGGSGAGAGTTGGAGSGGGAVAGSGGTGLTMLPAATPAGTATALPSYRLVALGIKAVSQATDDIDAVDGIADEIYVTAVINSTTRNLVGGSVSTVRSATHGDLGSANAFPGRVRAGTATTRGGIRAGDAVPGSLSLATSVGALKSTSFPFLLWQGVLDDNAMVVVHPSLWEEDGIKSIHDAFVNYLKGDIARGYRPWLTNQRLPAVTGLRDQDLIGPAIGKGYDCGLCLPLYGLPTPGQDRPIGLIPDLVVAGHYASQETLLVLTRSAIEKALAGSGPLTGTPGGTIVIPFFESGSAKAMYQLFLRVERFP